MTHKFTVEKEWGGYKLVIENVGFSTYLHHLDSQELIDVFNEVEHFIENAKYELKCRGY